MATSGGATVVDVAETKPAEAKAGAGGPGAWAAAHWRAILAEVVATAMLVLFGCMACIPVDGLSEQSPIYAPLGFGLTVLFLVQIFGHVSGAHLNPAVTLAALLWGSTTPALAAAYALAQTAGAAAGYGALVALAPADVAADGVCVTAPHRNLGAFQTLFVEVALTAVLAFLCCAMWDPVNAHRQESAAIKFGLTITALSLAGGPLTGASLNPARSLAPALWTGQWLYHWAYWAGPLLGAALATVFYKFTFLKK